MKTKPQTAQEIKESLKVAQEESKTKTPPLTSKPQTKSKPANTGYTYTYILSTVEQRKAIKLTEHKTKLDKIIKGFFGDRLISLEYADDSYTLRLKDEYSIGDKRRLGRLISEGSDLQKFVKRVIYNGAHKDISGQLFRLKKQSEVVNAKI